MKKIISLGLSGLLVLSGCSLVSPYTLTFTNTPGSVVDPTTATVDLVVSAPTLAYVSKVACEGAEDIELLPIVKDASAVSTLHKLSLTAMEGMPAGAACEVTVTVFDPTTTETASSKIKLTMNGVAVEEFEEREETADTAEATEVEDVLDETMPEPETEVEVETSVETESPSDSTLDTNETNSSETSEPTGTDEQGA